MNRLRAANSVALSAADKAPTTGTPEYATDGDPTASPPVPATIWPAYAWNMVQEELLLFVTMAGFTPDDTNWGQVYAAAEVLFVGYGGPDAQAGHKIAIGWSASGLPVLAVDGTTVGAIATYAYVASAVAAETSRAEGAEGSLQTAINAEVSRAESAETTLQNNLNAEISRAETAEAQIRTFPQPFFITGSTTITVPAGAYRLELLGLWGPGGSSGGSSGASSTGGSGGGGACVRCVVSVTPGNVLTVTIGTAGTPGNNAASNASAGTDSMLTGPNVAITAGAGGPGQGATGANGLPGAGGTGTVTGSAVYNVEIYAGTIGQEGFSGTGITVGPPGGGAGLGSGLSPSSSTGNSTPANGQSGTFPGGGASGPTCGGSGALGAPGYLQARWLT